MRYRVLLFGPVVHLHTDGLDLDYYHDDHADELAYISSAISATIRDSISRTASRARPRPDGAPVPAASVGAVAIAVGGAAIALLMTMTTMTFDIPVRKKRPIGSRPSAKRQGREGSAPPTRACACMQVYEHRHVC